MNTVLLSFPATFGSVFADPGGAIRLEADPSLPGTLRKLHDAGLRVGAIVFHSGSSPHDVVPMLAAAGIVGLDESLIVPVAPQDRGRLNELLAERTIDPEHCVVVSDHAQERATAVAAGAKTSPHVSFAAAVLAGEELRYAAFEHDDPSVTRALLKEVDPPFVPMAIDGAARPSLTVLTTHAYMNGGGLPAGCRIRELGSTATVAGNDLSMFYPGALADGDREKILSRIELAGASVLDDSGEGWILASPNGHDVEVEPLSPSHGHTFALTASRRTAGGDAIASLAPGNLDEAIVEVLKGIDASLIQGFAEPWFMGPIHNRSRFDPGNAAAVDAMYVMLEGILGAGNVEKMGIKFSSLHNVVGTLPGADLGEEVVILGAHLDSIGHLPCEGKAGGTGAPGADDDASGVAAVLACAHAFMQLHGQNGLRPRRTIEFVLFNNEELGATGSMRYAQRMEKRMAAGTARYCGMVQVDMVGYQQPAGTSIFEVHGVGPGDFQSADATLVARVGALTQAVCTASGIVSGNLAPQSYPMEDCAKTPSATRSDHRSFLLRGLPACLVTENFFSDLVCGNAVANPNYHTPCDTTIHYPYAADIARAIAAAVWMIANPQP